MDSSTGTSRIVDRWVHDNSRTIVLGLEAMRGPLARVSRGVINAQLFHKLERTRAERMDRRMFAAVVFGDAGGGAISVEAAVQDVGAAGEQPFQLPGVITVGRHDRCDFGKLHSAALRHALLMAHPPREGEPARIEAIDLASGVGLGVGFGRGSSQLLAARRMRFGVGDFTVLAFLAEPGELLFPEGEEAALASLDQGAQSISANLHVPVPEREDVPPTRALRHIGADPAQMWSDGSQVSMGTLVQRIDTQAFILEATRDELVEGVLLGRYPRCQGSLELGRDGSVSRVHALILRRRGRRLLVDCGSTNGTELQSEGCRPVHLGADKRVWPIDPGDDILLGDVSLRFTLTGEAEA